jgi:hypothetical protein
MQGVFVVEVVTMTGFVFLLLYLWNISLDIPESPKH